MQEKIIEQYLIKEVKMTTLSRCQRCKKDFPEHLVHSMHVDYHDFLLCALCALKVQNTLFNLPKDTPFNTKIAKEYWEEAIEYARKNH